MAFAWTSPDADCTVVGSQPPAEGVSFVEVPDGTDPATIYVDAAGVVQDVPPAPDRTMNFLPSTGEWVDPRSIEDCAADLRRERDTRLRACDWTQTLDAPLTPAQGDAWRQYRSALRDLPATTPDPRNPSWPLPPAE